MEKVILVNDKDKEIGVMEKMEAHKKAMLHRAFSVFIFNDEGEMLLQQRAINKYHSGGLWSNACCSHPKPGEQTITAARRRLFEEMGFETVLSKIFHFTYKAMFDNGLTEFEYDHVFVGKYNGTILPDAAEIQDYCYKSIKEIEASLLSHKQKYSQWFQVAFPKVAEWFSKHKKV